MLAVQAHASGSGAPPLPQRLSETGWSESGAGPLGRPLLTFSPQYPLWSDGAAKRRWAYLPPGAAIDASDPDAWEFPRGTRLWKEFRHERPVETRYIERLEDGSWRFATYIWSEGADDAELAPASGWLALPVAEAPRGRYDVPSREDCLACHEAAPVPVLGFGALQLSPDRDAGAPHAEAATDTQVDLPALVRLGLLENLPPALLEQAPALPAVSPRTRAALGYLHGNCGHCHNPSGPLADLQFSLLQRVADMSNNLEFTMTTLLGRSEFRAGHAEHRVVAGKPEDSVLLARLRSRNPLLQMPPLGSRVADLDAVALIEDWVANDLTSR